MEPIPTAKPAQLSASVEAGKVLV